MILFCLWRRSQQPREDMDLWVVDSTDDDTDLDHLDNKEERERESDANQQTREQAEQPRKQTRALVTNWNWNMIMSNIWLEIAEFRRKKPKNCPSECHFDVLNVVLKHYNGHYLEISDCC